MIDAELDDRADHSPTSSSTPAARHDPSTDTPSLAARLRTGMRLLPRRTVIFLIDLYRTWISPMRLPTCRFEPTCSGYAVEALERHGFVYGSTLAVIRLLKCGPWHKPGYDPVPERGPRDLWHDLVSRLRTGGRGHDTQHPSRRDDST